MTSTRVNATAPRERLRPLGIDLSRLGAEVERRRQLADGVASDRFGAYANLGPVRIADGVVIPLVLWNDQVLGWRNRTGLEPAVDRLTLRERLEWVAPAVDADADERIARRFQIDCRGQETGQGSGSSVAGERGSPGHRAHESTYDLPAASPVADLVWVSIDNPAVALRTLSRLRGYGRTLLVRLEEEELDVFLAAETNWRGITILEERSPARTAEPLGSTRSRTLDKAHSMSTSCPGCAGVSRTNLRFEQLVDLAFGLAPAPR